jgi:hypothetical protein
VRRLVLAGLLGLCLGSCASFDRYADFGLSTPLTPTKTLKTKPKPVAIEAPAVINNLRVQPPYEGYGIGTAADIRGASFTLTKCQKALYSDNVDQDRGVSIAVPARFNLLDFRTVNTLLIAGFQYGLQHCRVKSWPFEVPNEQGITVKLIQHGEVAVETGSSGELWSGSVGFKHVQNFIAERHQAKQTRLAREAWWNEFWSSVRWWITTLILLAVAPFVIRRLPRTLITMKWFLFPHPAIRELRQATSPASNQFVDARLFEEAMRFRPANNIESELARKDIEWLRKRASEKNQRLQQSEALIKEVWEMEHAKKRNETLRKAGGARG